MSNTKTLQEEIERKAKAHRKAIDMLNNHFLNEDETDTLSDDELIDRFTDEYSFAMDMYIAGATEYAQSPSEGKSLEQTERDEKMMQQIREAHAMLFDENGKLKRSEGKTLSLAECYDKVQYKRTRLPFDKEWLPEATHIVDICNEANKLFYAQQQPVREYDKLKEAFEELLKYATSDEDTAEHFKKDIIDSWRDKAGLLPAPPKEK